MMFRRYAIATFATAVAIICGYLQDASAQDEAIVSMISVEEQGYGEVSQGAGIIFGHKDGRAFIVTAAHVLAAYQYTDQDFESGRVQVKVDFRNGLTKPAIVRAIQDGWADDSRLDLAILEVAGVSDYTRTFEAGKHVLAPAELRSVAGDGLFSIGYAAGFPWASNRRPDLLRMPPTGEDDPFFCFESSVVEVGQSGGALFDEFGALRGMVLEVGGIVSGDTERACDGIEANALAIDWTTVAQYLGDQGYQVDLKINPSVLKEMASRTLDAENLDSNSELGRLLLADTLDRDRLSLYWIAEYNPSRFEELLQSSAAGRNGPFLDAFIEQVTDPTCRVDGGATTRMGAIASTGMVLSSGLKRFPADCSEFLTGWFAQMIGNGVDPNLIVGRPRSSMQEDGSLLSSAFRSGAADFLIMLLEEGAFPNPYFDLTGREGWKNSFVDPLWALSRLIEPADQDRVFRAFQQSGVVVFREDDGAPNRVVEFAKALSETEEDRVCVAAAERDGFDWCSLLRRVPNVYFETPVFTKWGDTYGKHTVQLAHTLFISSEAAYVLGWLPSKSTDGAQTVVVEIPRQAGRWAVYWYYDMSRCRSRDDGFEPSRCWRKYDAKPNAVRVASLRKPAAGSDDTMEIASKFVLEGVSLNSKVAEAISTLESKGYETSVIGSYTDYPDRILTLPYQIYDGENYVTVTLNTLGEEILMVSRESNSGGVYDEFLSLTEALDTEFNDRNHGITRTLEYTRKNLAAIKRGDRFEFGVGVGLVSSRHRDPEIAVLFRRPVDLDPIVATVWSERLGESFSPPKSPEPGETCIDGFRLLRIGGGRGCLTLQEHEAAFLKANAERDGVVVLPSGVQYEVLLRSGTQQLKAGESIFGTYRYTSLDDIGESPSSGGVTFTVGDAYPAVLNDVLTQINRGDKIRVYIPSQIRWERDEIGVATTQIMTFTFSE